MNSRDEFSRNMEKLFVLLQKILLSQKGVCPQDLSREASPAAKSANINVFFFTFLPVSPEEMDEIEEAFEEMMFGAHGEGHSHTCQDEVLKFELDARDVAFLKSHGISF